MKYVNYHGRQVAKGWPQTIRDAQKQTTVNIGKKSYGRITFGGGNAWEMVETHCPDCATLKGDYHVEGCDVECCPACGRQLISCFCETRMKNAIEEKPMTISKHQRTATRQLAERIKQFRLQIGLSQEALAAKARLHRTYVSLLERGNTNPSLNILVQLARAFNVPVRDLLP